MQTLSNWYKKAKVGTLAGTLQYSLDLIALLEENKKLKQQLKTAKIEKFFKKSGRVLCHKNSVRYAYMKKHKNTYPTTMMARLLNVSVLRLYDWLKQGLSQRKIQSNQ